MATRAKKRRADDLTAVVPVCVVGYQFDDQAIDQLIEMTFRMFERLMTSQNVIRAIHLYAQVQKRAAF